MNKAFTLNKHKNHSRMCGGPQGSEIPSLENNQAAGTPDYNLRGWTEKKAAGTPDYGFRGWTSGTPGKVLAGWTNHKGFTLIELLVVVLIIGILAAVALPQYQTAVNKSRYAGLMPLAKSVKQAEEEILMANGAYTNQLNNLSVQIPGTISGNTATGDKITVELYDGEGDYGYVKTSRSDLANTYVMYFDKSGNFGGEIHCEAEKGNEKAKQLCLSYGPSNPNNPVTGTDSNYDAYFLEGTGDGTGSGASAGCGSSGCYGDTQVPNGVIAWLEDYGGTVTINSFNNGWYNILADDGFFYNPELNILTLDDQAYFFGDDGAQIGFATCQNNAGSLAHQCTLQGGTMGACTGECPNIGSL